MRRLCVLADRLFEVAVILIFIAMVVSGGLQVFNRFVLNRSLSWSEELQRYAHIWLIYLAIPIAYRRNMHLGMDILKEKFPNWIQGSLSIFVHLLWIGFSSAIIIFSRRILIVSARQVSPGLGLPMNWVYFGMVLGAGYLLFVALRKFAEELIPSLDLGATTVDESGEELV